MNNILNKIAQMERNAEEIKSASHKVELANVKDVNKFTQEIRDTQSKLNKSFDAFNVAENNISSQRTLLKSQIEKSESFVSELKKQLNELVLGINSIDGIDRLLYEIESSKKNYLK